jgi:hypothetical protein
VSRLLILYSDPISNYSVLTRFRDSLLEESHRLTFARSCFMATSTSCIDLPDTVNVVSSANILGVECSKQRGKSFIYRLEIEEAQRLNLEEFHT